MSGESDLDVPTGRVFGRHWICSTATCREKRFFRGARAGRAWRGQGIARRTLDRQFCKAHAGERLPVGAVIAIEPIVNMGKGNVKDGPDGFTYQTADGSLSAHFEHTVAITKDGPEVLTV